MAPRPAAARRPAGEAKGSAGGADQFDLPADPDIGEADPFTGPFVCRPLSAAAAGSTTDGGTNNGSTSIGCASGLCQQWWDGMPGVWASIFKQFSSFKRRR
mmetsp:Transcript_65508/g.185803  ORF Transcript_65508/g.185803 Transcript_65508/m.185803 type:complete len:101 (+) Transcript_65508:504-806(+)